MTYTLEQRLRKAWLDRYGNPAGYQQATQQQKEQVLNETNDN